MYTLFSMESTSDNDNELLIDKVIRKADEDKQGLRVTADLIKQRQQLKVQIDKELNTPDEKKDEEGDSEDGTDDSSDTEGEDSDTKDEDTSSEDSSESSDDKPDDKDKSEDKQEGKSDKEDSVDASQDEGDLEAMMGSGHEEGKADKEEVKENKPAEKKEVAKESITFDSLVIPKLFNGIRQKHLAYSLSMEQYNLAPKSNDPKEQPVAHVKEEVVESLNTIVKLANTYIAKNTAVVEKGAKALASLNESLTVYAQCHDAGKLHLTLKVVSSEDKLRALCSPGQSDLAETSNVMLKYLTSASSLSAMVLENDLASLGTSLTSSGYKEDGDAFTYEKVLPGFNQMSVACSQYKDYLTTKYQDYQAYRTQGYKVQELYDLSGVTLADDNAFTNVVERLTGIVTQVAMTLDNLRDVSIKYNELIEQVKATCYDVQQGKVKQLSSLDIDSRLKDFIRFKVVSELYTTSVDVASSYVVSAISAMSELVELNN